ncbi:hypothetical protein BSKO_05133 [Bryopsis sp. KO-2023]|nr:hypothetical protein BSKO_05133 [Bryopsis sp. KO-2023]
MKKRPSVNIVDRLARRQDGERETSPFFRKTPRRLLFPVEDIVDAKGALLECIILGFTRDGDHLISYKRRDSETPDYSLQLWKFVPCQPVELAIEIPLFKTSRPFQELRMDEMVISEEHMSIAVHEVVHSTFLIVHGLPPSCSRECYEPPVHHITIIPYRSTTLSNVKVMHLRCIGTGFSVIQPSGFLFTRSDDVQIFRLSQRNGKEFSDNILQPPLNEHGIEMEEILCRGKSFRANSECVGVGIQRIGHVIDFSSLINDETDDEKLGPLLDRTIVVLDGFLMTEHEGTINVCIGLCFGGLESEAMLASVPEPKLRVLLVMLNVLTNTLLTKKVIVYNLPVNISKPASETLKCAAVLRREIKRLAPPRPVHQQPHVVHNIGMLQTGDSARFIMHPTLPWGLVGPRN